MGRPRKKTPKVHVNLSLSQCSRALGIKLSYESDESLSEMVERLLEAENDSRAGLLPSILAEDQAPYHAQPASVPKRKPAVRALPVDALGETAQPALPAKRQKRAG